MNTFKVLVLKCSKCWAYTDYLKNEMCLTCFWHPWEWNGSKKYHG